MLSAIAKSNKEVVVAKGANGKEEFSCPDCNQAVYPRRRAKWTDHFVHKPNSVCKTKLVASLESDEHKRGKQDIAAWLKGLIRNDPSFEIVIEKTITTLDGQYREIDVALVKNGKVTEAHECQFSPICILGGKKSLQARILDYYQLGISSTWWMGEKANTDTIREYLLSLTGRANENYRLTERESILLVGYTIEPDTSAKLEKIIEEQKIIEDSEDRVDSSFIEFSAMQPEKFNNSLFRYGNPQTTRLFFKEAIANALDQNPSDATALCSAWEKIQSTLGKPIKVTPGYTSFN